MADPNLLGPRPRDNAAQPRPAHHADAGAGPAGLAGGVQLKQVVLNLVANGIEAMSSVEDRPRELFIRSHRHRAWSRCGIPESASAPRAWASCSTPSSPRRPVAWAWACRCLHPTNVG